MRSHCVFATLLGAGLALLIALPSSAEDAPSKEKIDKLIDQLGSGSFAERETASKELAAIGVPALDALHKAAKSDDAEVRKRAEDILPKIERLAESARVLGPKRVHLVYKDTPLGEAVADFAKKSRYPIQLHDLDGKLAERKITLDTGETTFWHAFGLFLDKADLSEATLEDLMRAPQAPAVPGAQPIPGRPKRVFGSAVMAGMFGPNGGMMLKDGKAKSLPSDDRSSARIRVLEKSDQLGNAPEGEVLLALEVKLEPKLQLQMLQGVHIEKARDDRDQKLAQVIPQVEGAVGAGVNPALNLLGKAGVAQMQAMRQLQARRMMMQLNARQQMGGNGQSQQVAVQLKKGTKGAKSLKELQGVVTAQLLTEERPVITADKLDKAVGKSFKGEEGGAIKIVEVKTEDNETTIQLELEQPPFDKVMPAQFNFAQGVGARLVAPPGLPRPPLPPVAGRIAPPPAKRPAAQPPAVALPAGLVQRQDSLNGLAIQDDKGNTLPIDGGRSHVSISLMQQPNAPPKQATVTWTLVCPHEKDKGKPAKVVYLGRKSVSIDIPFVLKDVPLP